MSLPIVGVAGLGRCGTSLVMRMLHAGGMDVVANTGHVSYEDTRVTELPENHGWLAGCSGKAVKFLDVNQRRPPDCYDYVFLFIERDARQQAKSAAKFMRHVVGVSIPYSKMRRLRRSLQVDTPKARAVCESLGPTAGLAFERIINYPERAARLIADFLRGHGFGPLNVAAMRNQVKRRSPACYPGFMELEELQ